MSARDAAKIPKRIDSIRFTLMDPNEIRKMSSVEVKTADTYKDDGHAFKQGLMDPKMGVIDPGIRCETCGNKHEECPKSLRSHSTRATCDAHRIHRSNQDVLEDNLQLVQQGLAARCSANASY